MTQAPPQSLAGDVLAPILEDLNEPQRRAVTHGDGPLLVLAGAGTGKTRVITRRIAWLVAAKRARPSQILALTFTEKAAAEMEERVDVLVPYGYADVALSTFHAFGRKLLAEYALLLDLPGEPRVLNEAEALVLLRERLFDLPLARLRPLADPTRHLGALLGVVSRARDEGVSPEEYAAWARDLERAAADDADRERARQEREIAEFYAAYLELLQAEGLCDYAQLQWLALRLLEDHPRVRREVRERYRYVLVDEFQDTNVVQFRLLRALLGDRPNLTVVGDDDQSIYRFRGAAYSNLLAFLETYPSASRIVLLENYRSTSPILDAAYRLVRHNDPDRLEVQAGIDKRLVATRGTQGPPPSFDWHDTASSAADAVVEAVRDSVRGGRRYGDHAILVRTHLSARPILQALAYRGVPARYAGNRGLYDAEEIELCQALLRAIADPGDTPAFWRLAGSEIYRVPPADLARLSGLAWRRHRPLAEIAEGAVSGADEEAARGLGAEAREAARRLLDDLAALGRTALSRPAGEVLYRFLERSGWLERLSSSGIPGDEHRVQNLARFFEIVRDYGALAREDRVSHFVRHLALLREAGDDPPEAEPDEDDDAVQVLTVHRAKGLEFQVVHLVDLEEGRFPLPRRGTAIRFPDELLRERLPEGDAHVEEERRLFYVAMTRARDELHLSGARDLGGRRSYKPSRFVLEALDLPVAPSSARKTSAREALARHAPEAEPPLPEAEPIAAEEILPLSHEQIADYRTCPLKYRYAHVLRVPLLPYHGVIYGLALHNAIRAYYRQVLAGWPAGIEDALAAYRSSWRSEGFLTREHEESRFAAGRAALERFVERESASPHRPHAVEREFRFHLDHDLVRGRFDRLDLREEGPVVVDFKSSDVRDPENAERRARGSLQLAIYALAYRELYGEPPVATELHFVESGLVGRAPVTEATFAEAEAAIREASAGIRARRYEAAPSYAACRQCAFRNLCPERYGG